MSRRGVDRAVTVQIGAVLLLAIVFSALALYQVNAVPVQNHDVEADHNDAVQDELQQLRNAIQTVGADGGTRSTAVTLGTRYPSRTFASNPPAPTGRLETTGTATVSIENATVTGGAYDGDPDALLGDHETTTLAYRPDYNEYRSAPTTRIEHGFAYNDFGDAQISLADQPLLANGTVRLVALNGTLSESGHRAVSLDPTILGGPSDPVPIEPDGGPITITVPTAAPTAWNESLGTTVDDGVSDARVVGYEDTGDDHGLLTVELSGSTYDLQVARVGIGDGGEPTDRYDVRTAGSGGGSGGSGAYDVAWNLTRIDDDNPRVTCSSDSCTFDAASEGDTASMTVETTPSVDGASVEYAVSNDSVGSFSPGSATIQNGAHTTDLEAWTNGTVTVFASSGGAGDRVPVEITVDDGGSGASFDVATDGTNSPVTEGEVLTVTATVENTGTAAGTQDVSLETDSQQRDATTVTLGSGESTQVTLEWATAEGDAGDYTAVVSSADTSDSTGVTVESGSDPSIDDLAIVDGGTGNDRYDVTANVSDPDGDLDRVEFELRDTADRTVDTDDDATIGGATDTGEGRLTASGNDTDSEYTIYVTVYDERGGAVTETRTVVA